MPKNRINATRSAIANGGITLPPNRAGFTPEETAQIFGVSRAQVYLMLDRGELVAFKIGRHRRITPESIRSYVETHLEASPAS